MATRYSSLFVVALIASNVIKTSAESIQAEIDRLEKLKDSIKNKALEPSITTNDGNLIFSSPQDVVLNIPQGTLMVNNQSFQDIQDAIANLKNQVDTDIAITLDNVDKKLETSTKSLNADLSDLKITMSQSLDKSKSDLSAALDLARKSATDGDASLSSQITALQNQVTQVANCNKQGKLFDGSKCVAIAANQVTQWTQLTAPKCTKELQGQIRLNDPKLSDAKSKRDSSLQACVNSEWTALTNPPLGSCYEYQQKDNRGTGVYRIHPASWVGDPFEVFCDMDSNGGGWTLLEGRGGASTAQDRTTHGLPVKGVNEGMLISKNMANIGNKKTGEWTKGDVASLGREKINAIYKERGLKTVLKSFWSHHNDYYGRRNFGKSNGGGCVNWYYQKKKMNNNEKEFDLFMAMRNTKHWSSARRGGKGGYYYLTSSYYTIGADLGCSTTSSSFFDGQNGRNRFDGMYAWEFHNVKGTDGKTWETSRHGIPGDPKSGGMWEFYFGSNQQNMYGYDLQTVLHMVR